MLSLTRVTPVPPRQPTVIYYFSTKPEENTAVYNVYYNATKDANGVIHGIKDWNYILNWESDRVLSLLMSLRQDAYMFHQANLRAWDLPTITMNGRTGRFSLIQQWSEAVIGKLTKLVTWPIISPSLDGTYQCCCDSAQGRGKETHTISSRLGSSLR